MFVSLKNFYFKMPFRDLGFRMSSVVLLAWKEKIIMYKEAVAASACFFCDLILTIKLVWKSYFFFLEFYFSESQENWLKLIRFLWYLYRNQLVIIKWAKNPSSGNDWAGKLGKGQLSTRFCGRLRYTKEGLKKLPKLLAKDLLWKPRVSSCGVYCQLNRHNLCDSHFGHIFCLRCVFFKTPGTREE